MVVALALDTDLHQMVTDGPTKKAREDGIIEYENEDEGCNSNFVGYRSKHGEDYREHDHEGNDGERIDERSL